MSDTRNTGRAACEALEKSVGYRILLIMARLPFDCFSFMLPYAAARGRCLPDSLIRREPYADDTIAREKLAPTAVALRRLVYQLDDLGLPIEPYWRRDGGLAFDLLSSYSTGERVTSQASCPAPWSVNFSPAAKPWDMP